VFVTAGVRHDDNSVSEDFTTWRLAAAWALKPLGLRPHVSAGTAVKFPTMFEQFGRAPGFTPNPGLKPEELIGWDAGVEVTLTPAAALDVTYFHSELTNKIVATFVDVNNVPGVGTRDGVEFALRTKLTSNLSGTFAYTYLLAEDANDIQEVRRPRHAGRADLAYVFAGGLGTANLGIVYNGSITDFLFLNGVCCPPPGRIGVDDYWVVNAALAYKLDRGVELFGRVENLLDERYQEVFGFQAAPIAALAGIKLTLGGPDGVGGTGVK
jgi:vitamin B12 transporter